MASSELRRPWRAFLITPIVFVVFYIASIVIPVFIFEGPRLINEILDIFVFVLLGLPIAWLAAVILGFPVYHILKNSRFETAITCILVTAISASIVYVFLEMDFSPPAESSSYSWGDSGGRIIQDNVRTTYGWWVFAKDLFRAFFLGAVSGLVFWRLYSGKWWGRIDT